NTDMFRSFLLTALRNLLKNRLNAVVNIVGLTVAFICSILLFLMVHYEFSFDRFHSKLNALYQVYYLSHEERGDQKGDAMSYPVTSTLKAEVPGIVRATSIMQMGNDISYKGKELRQSIEGVDNDFFSMFSFPVIRGNASSPLQSLNSAVVSESAATAIFGK